jgi:hypothetical protein
VLSYEADGDALPDLLWSPPEGSGRATSVLPRAGGGLLVSGVVEDDPPPGWWTVAFDGGGAVSWSHFEGEEVPAGAFSGAFLLSADPVRVWADDETACGLFSLQLWSLDAATGEPLWDAKWPPPGDCSSFIPSQARLAGDRIVVAGHGNVPSVPASFDAIALSFDASSGAFQWARSHLGATIAIEVALASNDGSALVATTLFPPENPGPTPLWLSGWDRAGDLCATPVELPASRVNAVLRAPELPGTGGAALVLVGGAFNVVGTTADDLVVQRVLDPCAGIFTDGFESGDTDAWSTTGIS